MSTATAPATRTDLAGQTFIHEGRTYRIVGGFDSYPEIAKKGWALTVEARLESIKAKRTRFFFLAADKTSAVEFGR